MKRSYKILTESWNNEQNQQEEEKLTKKKSRLDDILSLEVKPHNLQVHEHRSMPLQPQNHHS